MTDANAPLRLGIDFGGTKTEIIGLDAQSGKELYRKRIPTPRDSYKTSLQSFKELTEEAEKELGMEGSLGMGIPGSVSQDTGTIKNSNSVWMNGRPLKQDLKKLMGREIRMENDANCLGLSEATDGVAKDSKVVFGVIIGTGSGASVIINGELINGVNGIAGEWGHTPLPNPRVYVPKGTKMGDFKDSLIHEECTNYPHITHDIAWNEIPGPKCYCGRNGCQEVWISGTGFKMDYKRVTGEELSTHDVITNMRKKEPKAMAAFERYTDRLARALGNVINILDPDMVVLGGGMGNVSELYDDVPKIWDQYIFSDFIHTQLKPPMHGDSSGVRGAAWLWPKK